MIGSIPFGVIIVKLKTGKDVRTIESGRTGGSNVMRAAGFWAGLITGALDITKAGLPALLVRLFLPEYVWLHILVPFAAVIGHNYSIFLIDRSTGKIRLRGGAGGAPSIGGAIGLWFPSLVILLPVVVIIGWVIGYASVASLSVGTLTILIFSILAYLDVLPWQYIFYGVLVEIVLVWALRPNIKRLLNGTERVSGMRARKKVNNPDSLNQSS
jgi:acyl phosphate:glycerol-3-phosphate acyltransferase